MADVHDKETRSYNMSRIKGKNTKPEMLVRKFLHAQGFRYRLHVKNLPGKPDIVLPKYKAVIFVHGCFSHGHEGCNKIFEHFMQRDLKYTRQYCGKANFTTIT
ncbi:MAG: very short patch repair endonuclease [Segetibacter sp.]